jgi:hypothetical protein
MWFVGKLSDHSTRQRVEWLGFAHRRLNGHAMLQVSQTVR